MANDFLHQKDYARFLQFVALLQATHTDFGTHVLALLKSVFGYAKCNFWLADGNGALHSPVSTMGGSFLNEYMDGYYKSDALHPLNLGVSNAISAQLMVMDTSKPAASGDERQYRNFLHSHHIYSGAGLYLTHGGRLIGGIAVGRSENNSFGPREISLLRAMLRHISSALYTNQFLLSVEYEKRILEIFSGQSPTGLIICDSSLNIRHANAAAKSLCRELTAAYQSPPEDFIVAILAEHCALWPLGWETTLFTPALRQVRITVSPGGPCGNEKNMFVIMLFYDDVKITSGPKVQCLPQSLTVRERQVLSLIVQGKTNGEIACELYISSHTVKKYTRILFDKFQVKNRTSLIFNVSQLEKR